MIKLPQNKIEDIQAVHCVGIGGVGVSAMARFFVHRGADVTGSDASTSPIVENLRDEGITVTVGHNEDNVPEDVDLVIHSIAVPHDNPELARAREHDIMTLTYPEALGVISRGLKTIAVSGTHGKTTTTAMLAQIFADATLDPTIIVGSMLKDSHTNFVSGTDDWLVVEACEYKRSFHHLHPDILIITNIDNDHLDYFDDLSDIQDAFTTMINKTADDGAVVCNPRGETMEPVIRKAQPTVLDYTDITIEKQLQVFGDHNYLNAQAAVTAAQEVGVSPDIAKTAVSNFTGTWRRAQKKGETEVGALVYDDYGHHPSEIRSTLAGFQQTFPDRELIVAFQPHLFSRTKKLMSEFAQSFQDADHVIVLPIYAARETPDAGTSSQDLVAALKDHHDSVAFAEDFAGAQSQIKKLATADSLVLTQGAGDVYEIADNLISSPPSEKS